jgi:hypothetical protein
MKMIVLFALGLSLATIELARADVEWCDVEVDPHKPTSTDPVTIILSGWWPDSCVPDNSAVSVIGKDIYFDAIWDYPPFISCATMITGWTLADVVGPLLPGTYTVYARVVGYPLPDPPEAYEQVADFIVSDKQFVLSSESLAIPEGATSTFTVRLLKEPLGAVDVTVARESGDPDITVQSGAALTFDPCNYSVAQMVKLAAAADGDYLNGTAIISVTAPDYLTGQLIATEHDNQPPRILYVDANAPGANNGTSWENAYFYLQDALMFAGGGDEIRVAQGVYKPDDFVLSDRPSRGREETFQLVNGVTLKGGYAGFGGPDPNARDIDKYKTILSGDLNRDDVDVNNPSDLLTEPTRGENSCNVVTATDCNITAIIDGFTITAGNANGSILAGGGIYGGGPKVGHCKIIANSASGVGGGIFGGAFLQDSIVSHNAAGEGGGIYYCEGIGTEIISCTINGNSTVGGGGSGGGILFSGDCGATITDCVISSNSADASGGAIWTNYRCGIVFTLCAFIGNSSKGGGGAVSNNACTCQSYITFNECRFIGNQAISDGGGLFSSGYLGTQLRNCLFIGNRTRGNGGAIYDAPDAGTSLVNCTIADNIVSGKGGGICYESGCCGYASRGLINSIILGNSDSDGQMRLDSQIYLKDADMIPINYCCIPYRGGKGNIFCRPFYAKRGYWDPNGTPGDANDDFWADGDYHLKSQAGRWEPNKGQWVMDDVTSPCIDAGDPMAPIMHEPFPNGGIINMGAYGGTAEASKSYFGGPVCETIVAGDVNGDCLIDFKDFYFVGLHWLEGHN